MSEKNYPAIPDPEGVERVYGELLARAPENKMAPRLDAVARAVEILGDVHRAAPVIHITGTNGKTSTARMIEALLLGHDLRVGRFTSPHLESVTERICINGAPVPDATFVRIWDEIAPYLQIVDAEMTSRGEPALTFFESVTVLAFAIFADEPVDVVVLEVGIGGTWDSTNVADGVVSVVTPIGLPHRHARRNPRRDCDRKVRHYQARRLPGFCRTGPGSGGRAARLRPREGSILRLRGRGVRRCLP